MILEGGPRLLSTATMKTIWRIGSSSLKSWRQLSLHPKSIGSRRTFFASSTDHSTLLETAEVHKLEDETPTDGGGGVIKYVIAASGMDIDQVKKVPQLHLARIHRDGNTIYGAKVINKTLGTPAHVCSRLVDAAIQDYLQNKTTQNDDGLLAISNLHGLTDWVSKGLESSIDLKTALDGRDIEAVHRIISARNKDRKRINEVYDDITKTAWEKLAKEFVSSGLAEEASLYESKGGVLEEIDHLADTSEYASESCGAMAVFKLPSAS